MATEWSWEHTNGGATDAQTRQAYQTLLERGRTTGYSHHVWNDLASLVQSLRLEYEMEWLDTYTDFEGCLIGEDGVLTADKYNSVLINILNTGWPWKYDSSRPDYLGRSTMRRLDKVYATYLLELPHKYNIMIQLLDDTAGTPLIAGIVTDLQMALDTFMLVTEQIETESAVEADVTVRTDAELLNFSPTPVSFSSTANVAVETIAAAMLLNVLRLRLQGNTAIRVQSLDNASVTRTPPFFASAVTEVSTQDSFTEGSNAKAIDFGTLLWHSAIRSAYRFSTSTSSERTCILPRLRSDIASGFSFSVESRQSSPFGLLALASDIASVFRFTLDGGTASSNAGYCFMLGALSSNYAFTHVRLFVHNCGRARMEGSFTLSDSEASLTSSRDVECGFRAPASDIQGQLSGNADFCRVVFAGSTDLLAALDSSGSASVELYAPTLMPVIVLSAVILTLTTAEMNIQRIAPLGDSPDAPVLFSTESFSMSKEASLFVTELIDVRTENHIIIVDGNWLYPIQTESDLYIRQAKEITVSGRNLSLA